MKIFVTGGAGYVGSKLIPRLLELEHKVTVLDLMIYGEDVLPNNKNLIKITGDIRNTKLLKKFIPGHDAVIHLAGNGKMKPSEISKFINNTDIDKVFVYGNKILNTYKYF